ARWRRLSVASHLGSAIHSFPGDVRPVIAGPGPADLEEMQMKRAPLLLAGLIVAATSTVAAASSAGGAARAHDSRAAKIQLRHTEIGKVLVDSSGFTLYRFSKDPRNSDTCVKISGCTNLWPPLTSSGRPVAGPGVRAGLLSTIKLPGGGRQVTYAGHPL